MTANPSGAPRFDARTLNFLMRPTQARVLATLIARRLKQRLDGLRQVTLLTGWREIFVEPTMARLEGRRLNTSPTVHLKQPPLTLIAIDSSQVSPVLSVVMPVYNESTTIERVVKAVLAQPIVAQLIVSIMSADNERCPVGEAFSRSV